MEDNMINGLNESQISQLFAYLVAYESSGICVYKSTKKLIKDHPELKEMEATFQSIQCHKADTKKMDECNLSLLTNEVFQSINKNNHLLSFLSHLRNSIAHGYIGGGDGYIHIIDFANPRSRPVDFTSRGRVEIGIINQFTNILNGIDL